MIAKNDVIEISFPSEDSINDAYEYAFKAWTVHFNRFGNGSPYYRMEKVFIGVLSENLFKEYLLKENIDFDILGSTPWHKSDCYDFGINGFQIDLKANLISRDYAEQKLNDHNLLIQEWLMKCSALVPLDQLNTKANQSGKKKPLYIWMFPVGDILRDEIEISMQNPCVHAFWDYAWTRKRDHLRGDKLGSIIFLYEAEDNPEITIYGTSEPKKFQKETVKLKNGETKSQFDYHSIFSIASFRDMPTGKLTVKSSIYPAPDEVIRPQLGFKFEKGKEIPSYNDWGTFHLSQNLRFYVPGWLTRDGFLTARTARESPRYDKNIEQYSETKSKNWACLINELNPIKDISNAI